MNDRRQRMRGHVPSYWWDFAEDMSIIVETDDPRAEGGVVCTLPTIEDAERAVADLTAGRPLKGDE